MPEIINVVELGPGPTPTDLLRFAKKEGRVLHGIDYGAQEKHIRTSGESTVNLFRGDFIDKLERYYKPNSIKSVRMKMVMRRGKTFQLVFERLVPGGRFMLSEPKIDLQNAIPELERIGFKVQMLRPAKEEEMTSNWEYLQSRLAEAMKDPSYLPWILVVSKPRAPAGDSAQK